MKYVYTSVPSGVTLVVGGEPKEFMFYPDHEYELPADNEYVQHLLELGHLKEVDATAAAVPEAEKTVEPEPSTGETTAPAKNKNSKPEVLAEDKTPEQTGVNANAS